MERNDRLKYWLNELCKNMNDAIENSGNIDSCIRKIKSQGFDLCVFLEATVCLSQSEQAPFHRYKKAAAPKETRKRRKLQLNREDKSCLKSLKIVVSKERKTAG